MITKLDPVGAMELKKNKISKYLNRKMKQSTKATSIRDGLADELLIRVRVTLYMRDSRKKQTTG